MESILAELNNPGVMTIVKFIGVSIVCAILWIIIEPHNILSAETRVGKRNRKKLGKFYHSITLGAYKVLFRFRYTTTMITNLEYMFKTRYCLEQFEAQVLTGRVIIIEAFSMVLSFIVFIALFKDLLLASIGTFIAVTLIFYAIRGTSKKFIYELTELIGTMLHFYNSGGHNIQNMFDRLEAEKMYLHNYLRVMREYLKKAKYSDNPKFVIEEYATITSSRFLRLIFNYLYITEKFGDTEDLFNTNMMALQRDIHREYMSTEQIEKALVSEVLLVASPVLMLPVMEWYMLNFFSFGPDSFVVAFLSTSSGYAVKVLCAVATMICFYCYMTLFRVSDTALEVKNKIDWADHLLLSSRHLYKFFQRVSKRMPKFINQKVEEKQVFDTGKSNIDAYYLKTVVFAILFGVVATTIVSLDTIYQRYTIRNSLWVGVDEEYMQLAIDSEDNMGEFVSRSVSNDKAFIRDINANGQPEDMYRRIAELGLDYGLYTDLAISRVERKLFLLDQTSIPIILSIIFTMIVFGAMIPFINLSITVHLKRNAMIYNEVMGFYTVTILLTSHPQSTVFMLVQWLSQFSHIFKQKLQICEDNFTEDTLRAVNDGIDYIQLRRLIDCILLAKQGISIKDAFAGVQQRYRFQEQEGEIVTARVLKVRTNFASTVTWISLGVNFGLYLILPMLLTIYFMMQTSPV